MNFQSSLFQDTPAQQASRRRLFQLFLRDTCAEHNPHEDTPCRPSPLERLEDEGPGSGAPAGREPPRLQTARGRM
jgi:hypothetical protein